MKVILFLPALLVAALLLLAQLDDELSPEAEAFISRIDTSGGSEAYLYLLGIYANEDDSPEKVGRQLLAEYRQQERNDAYEIIDYDESKKLALPTKAFTCGAWEEDCLRNLLESELNTDDLRMKHEILLSRSDRFHDFSEYKTLTMPSVKERIPPYQYLAAAERIKMLSALTLHKQGQSADAILALEDQLQSLRHSLALQDNLIGKLVFVMQISTALDFLSVISSQAQLSVTRINGLSGDEKGLAMAAAREFQMSYAALKEADRHPEFFQIGGNVPGWIVRMLYKPNMTLNAIAPQYTRFERLSFAPASQFAQEVESFDEIGTSALSIRNYAGAKLVHMYDIFDEYNARFLDLDAKIVLFNHLNEGFENARNPYYEDEAPEIFADRACFRGPMEDPRSLRCLRTGI